MNIINIAHAGIITDAPSFSHIGINILNFLLSTAGIIAIISLVLAGLLYMASAGDEKKAELAKNSAKYSVIGIALAMAGMIAVKLIGQFFAK